MQDAAGERVKDFCSFLYRGHKSSCFFYCVISLAPAQLASRAILKSHKTMHVPIGGYFTFQIPHFPRYNSNGSKSIPATITYCDYRYALKV